MNKNIKLKAKKSLKSIWQQVKANKVMLGYMTAVIIMQDTTCFAGLSKDLPQSNGIENFYKEMTGPFAKTVCGIALAGGGVSYVMGTSQMTQMAGKAGIGLGFATGVPSILEYVSDGSGGCLF